MLSLAAAGLNSLQIAEVLGTSREVVRETLMSATEKLGARSKLEAVLIADRTGQIERPPERPVNY